jgi:hypothetical protein
MSCKQTQESRSSLKNVRFVVKNVCNVCLPRALFHVNLFFSSVFFFYVYGRPSLSFFFTLSDTKRFAGCLGKHCKDRLEVRV